MLAVKPVRRGTIRTYVMAEIGIHNNHKVSRAKIKSMYISRTAKATDEREMEAAFEVFYDVRLTLDRAFQLEVLTRLCLPRIPLLIALRLLAFRPVMHHLLR